MGAFASSPGHGRGGRDAVWLRSVQHLQRYLEENGVSPEKLGKGSAKSIGELFHELQSQACSLEPVEPSAKGSSQQLRVIRIVEPVFIRLCWRNFVLVEEEQQLTDGRRRKRKMLLAEKKEPCDGGGLFATIVRALHDELGLDVEKLQSEGALHYRADAYHFELEQIDSPSYPGLTSMYRTHHVMVDIPNESLELFQRCGLPECRDFVTLETTEMGTTTHFWRWYDTTKALREHVVKFPPVAMTTSAPGDQGVVAGPGWRGLTHEELATEEALSRTLEQASINPELYGQGKAKTIAALFRELRKKESVLEWQEESKALRRITEPVFIQFRWRDHVLVEVEQRFSDGRSRQRNMLMAEKKSPEDVDVCSAALRGVREELVLPKEFPLEDVVRFVHESYCCVAENLESSSYPGLQCVYVTHYCSVQIQESGLVHFETLGMLADEFETREFDKLNKWRWMLLDEARKAKVKGFPELKEQKSSGEDSRPFAYEPLETVPLDAPSLRVLLEVGGVNVNAWGRFAAASLQSLARELESGTARLELDRHTGAIRRVLQSNLVQLMVDETSTSSQSTQSFVHETRSNAFNLEEARGLVHFRTDIGRFEVLHSDSASYPGLPCCHQTRLVQFGQRSSGSLGQAESIGSFGGNGGTGGSTSDASEWLPLRLSGVSTWGKGFPRLLDDLTSGNLNDGRASSATGAFSGTDASNLNLPCSEASSRRFRRISIVSRDDGLPRSHSDRISLNSPTTPQSRSSRSSRISFSTHSTSGDSSAPTSPVTRRSVFSQLKGLQRHLRFRMVANEADEQPPPADQAVTCACEIEHIRNINPLNATFHCHFTIFLEWLDNAAIGLPLGEISPEKLKLLSIPEIGLQNTLGTSSEVHSTPEVMDGENGHVACKVHVQANMQMELNMRLFPFDQQRLVLVMGLRARRDRDRAIFAQFCKVDSQIRLDEWRVGNSFFHADRPDGRARVQFGVVISRTYVYYVLNVLGTLGTIAFISLVAFLLDRDPPYNRLRFGVSVLFAQTTFRLSIDSKLPKVSYSTAFDKYAMFCQMLVLVIMASNALVLALDAEVASIVDPALAVAFSTIWILANVFLAHGICRARQSQRSVLLSENGTADDAVPAATPRAHEQLEALTENLRYKSDRSRTPPDASNTTNRPVSVSSRIWLLHDIDPVSATFECKFSLYVEWVHESARGLKEGERLTPQQLKQLDPPEIDLYNKVEISVEDMPAAYVTNSREGHVMLCYRYHGRLQIRLNLRRFPFDCQCLPIILRMPSLTDLDRAFVFRSCRLANTAQSLDEWCVDSCTPSIDYAEGFSQATITVDISRRSGYYVRSVLFVLVGITSVVFTVFVIDSGADGVGFVDQGKILVPLLMTLLAFKLLISSGKIPKPAYATIFDRIMLASEALFFLTTLICSVTYILAFSYEDERISESFRTHASLVLLAAWVIFGLSIAIEVRWCKGKESKDGLPLKRKPTPPPPKSPEFEQQTLSLARQPGPGDTGLASAHTVLVRVQAKQIHSVNAAAGTFFCEFVASLAWLNTNAEGLERGEISLDRLQDLNPPKLRAQNALTCKQTLQGCCVVDGRTGHVACNVHMRAEVQLQFNLENFPFDRQALSVLLSLPPEPCNLRRQLVLDSFDTTGAVKISEWEVLGEFAGAGEQDGIAQLVFGVTIRRLSRYYVVSLASLCLWSIFVLTIYTMDVEEYRHRGKVLVTTLLVSIVGKLAVSSKLPRIARTTSYDRVALNSLTLIFCVGVTSSFWDLMANVGVLEHDPAMYFDYATGIAQLLACLLINMRIFWHMRLALAGTREPPPNRVPQHLTSGSQPLEWPAAVDAELQTLRSPGAPFVPLVDDTDKRRSTRLSTATMSHMELLLSQGISFGVKISMVCSVDGSSAIFESKFHIFLEWIAPEAAGLPESTRISLNGGQIPASKIPKLTVVNAISVLLEDFSDVEVKSSETGRVCCRVQYHVKLHHKFNLRAFPFDCQRLAILLELREPKGRFLVPDFCDADDQTKYLDGWRLAAVSMQQESDCSHKASVVLLVARQSHYYVTQVLAVFFLLTSLLFSFWFMDPQDISKRLVDSLKVVLTQTTFRFSVEHRLPKVQHWTPFDVYVLSCQVLDICVVVLFVYGTLAVQDPARRCAVLDQEHIFLAAFLAAWLLWNAGCALYAYRLRKRELRSWTPGQLTGLVDSDGHVSVSSSLSTWERPWELKAHERLPTMLAPQVVSVAFRIWLVRNVDLVTATFECKFRVFLEWLDDNAVGLPKGRKAKLPVPAVTITNALQYQVLDKSSAPEVVNSDTGHLAVQILYRARLRMDQEVRNFPFDCQWLAITLSLREELVDRDRTFLFQYCEVDNQLQLDEWSICPFPAFSTLTKQDMTSNLQDTVVCGIVVRRAARYYIVNIMGMLCLISSLVFSIYTIPVEMFWERAEVFIGIFPLTVIFKMSAQSKLPRVGYSTKFDIYAISCQVMFLVIVLGCIAASTACNLPRWLAYCNPADYDQEVIRVVHRVETFWASSLCVLWLAWNLYFSIQARHLLHLPQQTAVRSSVKMSLQDEAHLMRSSRKEDPNIGGLAPRLSARAKNEQRDETGAAEGMTVVV